MRIFDTLRNLFKRKPIDSMKDDEKVKAAAKHIENAKKIVVLAGAGLSTAAGIPDFRSPLTGIYVAYRSGSLRHPEDIFSYHHFKNDPKPFFAAVKALMPASIKPTTAHYFMRLLDDKRKLFRFATQNVDGLEQLSGIERSKIVNAHGTFATSHCTQCNKSFSFEWMHRRIQKGVVPQCDKCDGVVKPDVVLFGEMLPLEFNRFAEHDIEQADLIIIIGTSLKVQPFCNVHRRASCPIIIMNKESLAKRAFKWGLDNQHNREYVELIGSCDDCVSEVAKELGWNAELLELIEREQNALHQLSKTTDLVELYSDSIA